MVTTNKEPPELRAAAETLLAEIRAGNKEAMYRAAQALIQRNQRQALAMFRELSTQMPVDPTIRAEHAYMVGMETGAQLALELVAKSFGLTQTR